MNMRGFIYRFIVKTEHKYYWHYAPLIYPDGDTQLWCQWCGFRETIKRRHDGLHPKLLLAEMKKLKEDHD